MTVKQLELVDFLSPKRTDLRMIKDMPAPEQPDIRLLRVGERAISTAELMAIVMRLPDGLDRAQDFLTRHGIEALARMSPLEMQMQLTEKSALSLKAACELGRRVWIQQEEALPKISSPADVANLLMSELSLLEQEHLVVLPLSTRNDVLAMITVYKGSLNSSLVRIGELFRAAIQANAAALILAHNHPSGDPPPRPRTSGSPGRSSRPAASSTSRSLIT